MFVKYEDDFDDHSVKVDSAKLSHRVKTFRVGDTLCWTTGNSFHGYETLCYKISASYP